MTIQSVQFTSRSGQSASGALAQPENKTGKSPGVVLIQEWWGINNHIRSLITRLSAEGFIVLAPDLYHGKVASTAEEAGKMMGALNWPTALDEIAGAANYLLSHPHCNGKVGVMGFCMGGALSFASATQIPAFSAVVPFYGVPDPTQTDYSKVTAPILAHFASRDQWAKPEAAKAIQSQLSARNHPMELHVYEADHAFVNDTRPEVYHPDNAILAWNRSAKFLHQHLDG